MTSFNSFFSDNTGGENVEDMQRLDGEYGCQSCPNQTSVAYFDEKSMQIIWFCKDEHRSSIQVG